MTTTAEQQYNLMCSVLGHAAGRKPKLVLRDLLAIRAGDDLDDLALTRDTGPVTPAA